MSGFVVTSFEREVPSSSPLLRLSFIFFLRLELRNGLGCPKITLDTLADMLVVRGRGAHPKIVGPVSH